MSILSKIKKHVFSRNFNREYNLIRSNYKLQFVKEKVPILVIFCLDGRTGTEGFADRIKGMISCYAYAKATNIPFRIEHIVPFELSEYLVPNNYDWQLKEGEKSYNLLYANPVFFIQFTDDQHNMRLFWINKHRQHHLFTNAPYILNEVNNKYNKNYKFEELFNELFKPSLSLEKKINEQNVRIKNGEYISISFRFMQLMGDFKDIYGDILPEEGRIELLNKSLALVKSLHEKEQKTILVTSDSQTFLDVVSKLNYVYVIPGEVGHIGFSKRDGIFEKVFLDFYMISRASHVYMAHSGKMRVGGFAKTAAMTTNAPYDEITY